MNIENVKAGIQAVIDGLTPLAQKLGIAIEKVFGWAVRQNYSYAVIDILTAIGILIASRYVLKFVEQSKKNYIDCIEKKIEAQKDQSYKTYDESDKMTAENGYAFGVLAVNIGSMALAFVFLGFALYRIINPEISALTDIWFMIKTYK